MFMKNKQSGGCLLGLVLLMTAALTISVVMIRAQVTAMLSGKTDKGSEEFHLYDPDAHRQNGSDEQSGVLPSGRIPHDGAPIICIDAGHGFDDFGAMHANLNGLGEKDITLDIALRLAQLMRDAGYQVVLTRDSDEIGDMQPDYRGLYVLSPHDRCDIANDAQADLFVSIHCNSIVGDNAMNGTHLYYTKDRGIDDLGYTEAIADSLEEAFGERPRVFGNPENDSYIVNHWVDMPSVLVETGFITNKHDAQLMLTETWRQEMAEALAAGITGYLAQS